MKRKPVVALTMPKSLRKRLFDRENSVALRKVASRVVLYDKDTPADPADLRRLLKDADVVMTSWRSPCMTADVLELAPKLKMLCHAAGTVKPYVSPELWRRGIRVTSAAAANATPVAETTLGCMIFGVKDIFAIRERLRGEGWQAHSGDGSREMYRKTVGIIGASHVGRKVIGLLGAFEVKILLYDPYVSAREAARLGTTKVTFSHLLKTSDIVSLHAPSTEETRHMLGAAEFRRMKDNAIFINTARGAIVDESALVRELRKGRLVAFIDVTDPDEPPRRNHPFFKLDNVVLTPHIAGTVGDLTPMAKLAVEEVKRFAEGRKPLYPVTRDMLAHIG